MKIIVLGANGRTGTQVVQRALNGGGEVTAVVRSEAKLPTIRHDRLNVVVGDPCDPAILREVFRGQDALISTLGGRRPTKEATSVYPRSADAIVSAALETDLKRIVVTSTALLFPPRRMLDRILAAVVPNVVRNANRMERTLRASNLDVTIARCGFLTDAEETTYRASEGALPENGFSVSRRSLAFFLFACVSEAGAGHQVFGVSAA